VRRDNHGISPREAVRRRKWPVQYDLKSVTSLCLGLEISERPRRGGPPALSWPRIIDHFARARTRVAPAAQTRI